VNADDASLVANAYESYRVLGVSKMKIAIINKAAAPVTVGFLPSGTSDALPSSNLAGVLIACDRKFGRVTHLSSSAAGQATKTFNYPKLNPQEFIGTSYFGTETYSGTTSSGAFTSPTTPVFFQLYAAPTQGGNFGAATDPIFIVTAVVEVEGYNRISV